MFNGLSGFHGAWPAGVRQGPGSLEGLEKLVVAPLFQAGVNVTQKLGYQHEFLQIWNFQETLCTECGSLVENADLGEREVVGGGVRKKRKCGFFPSLRNNLYV